MPELVNHPDHYTAGGIEVLDYMRAKLPVISDGYLGYLIGNIIKYVSRAAFKGSLLTDMEKAKFYIDEAVRYILSCKDSLS